MITAYSAAFLIAGILFGLGFAAAGIALLRSGRQIFGDGKTKGA